MPNVVGFEGRNLSFLNFYSAVSRFDFQIFFCSFFHPFFVMEKIPYELSFKKQIAFSFYRFSI